MQKSTKNFFFAIALLSSLGTQQAFSQKTISGIVLDGTTDEPLFGATVIVKEDKNRGTTTGLDGKFSLSVAPNATTLLVSYTGFQLVEQPISGDFLTVKMSESKSLKEVLVIGYGTVKREDATGLVQSVSTEKFNKGAITSAQGLLAGKIAGVVISTDGGPGAGSKIRVRGESSLSANNDPLIVVDGVPLGNGDVSGGRNQLNLINPNDIESFTVLKDASAAAIYGNRASAGVILITTKKGTLGKKISVDYSATVSAGQTSRRTDALTADEFRAAVTQHYPMSDPNKPNSPTNLLGTANTDWQDQIFRTAIGTDHNLSIAGGFKMVPYRVAFGYTNQDGLLKTDNFQRETGSLSLSPKFLNNRLQVNFNLKGMLQDNHFADRGAIGNALRFDPTKPVHSDTTSYGGFTTWTIANGNPNALAATNPVALLELRDDNSTVKQYIVNGSVDYRFGFLPALRANIAVGYDHAHGEGSIVVPNYAAFAFDSKNGGGVNNTYSQTKYNAVWESYLNYKKAFGQHDVELMGGYSWQHFYVTNKYRDSDSAGSPSKTYDAPAAPAEYFLISTYARLNYGFQNKYLFTASVRRDGTSRFGPDFRQGLFPAAALGVKLIENDHRFFNFVKVRASVGATGQQEIGDYYAYLARYKTGQQNAEYQFGDEFVTTIRPNGYIANIQWEESVSYNGGLDFSLVRDRVSGSFDIYQKNTSQLLNFITVPALSNLTNEITKNIGTMEGKGVELSLQVSPVVRGNIRWDVAANVATNTSKITKLTLTDDPKYIGVLTGGIAGGVGSNIQIHTVGYSPASFYVYQQKYDENGKLLEGQFADLNGDSIVNEKDKYRFHNPAPRVTLGLTSNLAVGNFDFSFAARANLGNWVYNNVQTDQGYLDRLYGSSGYLENVNQSAVDLNVNSQANLTFSDHFVTNASFFKLDHVTVGYTFKFRAVKALRVSATVQNPLVVTKYEGLDPEIGNGIDNNNYPRPRTFLGGVSVSF